MRTGTEFFLLGPVVARRDGVALPVAAGKQRAVLAALLLSAGRAVSLDELAEVLWGAATPPSARVSVQNHVMRLRKALGDPSLIGTAAHGYLLQPGDGQLDLAVFEGHLAAARAAARAGVWQTAAARARDGLALWRGDPLADVESELLAIREVPRLAELRLQAAEIGLDADLRLGRHDEVITELRRLTAEHPLRERLHGTLMLALYRDGRQAEALAAYAGARQILAGELGTEPGAALRELHQQILTGDAGLDVTSGGAAAATPGPAASPPATSPPATSPPEASVPPVPRELPAPVAHFAGRCDELAALTKLLDSRDDHLAGTVVISAIGGTAGVGKTALAVQWAQQAAGRFPDGQLYVNLRGYDPERPVPAADALAGFLRALGVPGHEIPADEDQRAARYRTLLAGKRILVVLDNAGSTEQVRLLLPGTPSCAVVVTSRDSLTGLIARHGAVRLDLDLLPLGDAAGLLRDLIGDRAAAEPDAVAALAERCCRLPLALRVAAELAIARPDVPLAGLAGELADEHRLDLLDAGGDPRTAVRAVFSWSCRHLDDAAARAFRLAGLHPGGYFDSYAVAALTGTTLGRASRALDTLDRAHLVQLSGPDRYGMHDLLRAYARELAGDQDDGDARRAALTRLFDHYLQTATVAMDTLHPAGRDRRPRLSASPAPAPPLADPAAARAWLDAERANLVAVTVHAAGHGWPSHAARLGTTLFRYLDTGGHTPEAAVIYRHARDAARRIGDPALEARALNQLASTDWRQGRYQQASECLLQAVRLYEQAGDQGRQASVLINLGILSLDEGRYQQSAGCARQALELSDETGDLLDRAGALNVLGKVEERLGRYDEAAGHQLDALAIATDTGAWDYEGEVLVDLGTVRMRQGQFEQAASHLQRALELCRAGEDRNEEALALTRMADLRLRQGNTAQAADHLRHALAAYRDLGDRFGEADALNSLGDVLMARGQPGEALVRHAGALRIAGPIGGRHQQARAREGLGHACRAAGDEAKARRHWREALALYTELGVPEAGRVRAALGELASRAAV